MPTQILTVGSPIEEKAYRNSHGNHGCFLFFSVHVLNISLRYEIIPSVLVVFLPDVTGLETGQKSRVYGCEDETQQSVRITEHSGRIIHQNDQDDPHPHLQRSNILLLDEQALLLHDEERTTAASIISVQT